MTKLTLDNWRELFHKEFVSEAFIEELLIVQKQALKDEAVKRIEEEIREKKFEELSSDEVKDIIYNL